jgi:hypothetical protein
MNITEVNETPENISEVNETPDDMDSVHYHILTFAETGFAILSSCAKQAGLDWKVVE